MAAFRLHRFRRKVASQMLVVLVGTQARQEQIEGRDIERDE